MASSFTFTPLRKGSTPKFSKPKPFVTGRRPTLNKTFSPVNVNDSPSFSTETSVPCTPVTLWPK